MLLESGDHSESAARLADGSLQPIQKFTLSEDEKVVQY